MHSGRTHLQLGDKLGLFGGRAEGDVVAVLGIHAHDEVTPGGVQEDLMNSIRHSAGQLYLLCGEHRACVKLVRGS